MSNACRYTWEQVINEALSHPKHTDITVDKWQLPPIPVDFTERLADNDGQNTDYGLALEDNTGIHIKEYDYYYKVHWDEKDPHADPLGHLVYDAPRWLLIIGFILALGIDLLIFKGKYTKKLLNLFFDIPCPD